MKLIRVFYQKILRFWRRNFFYIFEKACFRNGIDTSIMNFTFVEFMFV